MSYYRVGPRGAKYDAGLEQTAADLQKGRGDGRISKADALKLSAAVYDKFENDTRGIKARTPTEDRTVARIYDKANFTKPGRAAFAAANRAAGAKMAAETRAANKAKPEAPVQPMQQQNIAQQS